MLQRYKSIPIKKIFSQIFLKFILQSFLTNMISLCVAFILRGAHPHDVATILGQNGVCIRAGHHCTQPIMDFFEIAGTVRASFSIYNDFRDVDALVAGLKAVRAIF